MPETIRKVNVIGHLHPDTDSICSAIALAYLKNQSGDVQYEARRAGTINRETAFVLKHFGFDEPQLITSVRPQIKDTHIQETKGIDPETSLLAAWNQMTETKTDTLCITDDKGDLEGLIALKDIASANLNVFDTKVLAESSTPYANVAATLKGELLLGDPEAQITTGKVVVGTTPEMMEGNIEAGDTVLVTNRYETQRFAVEAGASCLIVCNDARISNVVLDAAKENDCAVISTPYDTFSAARLVSMTTPVASKMLDQDKVLSFSVNTTVDEARKTITESRHRFFPVLDEDGHYVGMVSTPNLLDVNPKHVILVDHNERSQAVDGLEQAVIMEIVDHHRIGTIETDAPALFRNEPVGCTNTILYSMYQEQGVKIPANVAGLMMSAILSDTLAFRSPTCTPRDEYAARELAKICGEDIDEYADAMFDAGAALDGRSAEDVFHQDFKIFSRGNVRFGVGQGSFMTKNSRKAAEALVGPYLKEGAAADELPMVFYMFTDVKTSTTELLYFGENTDEIVKQTFGVDPVDGIATLPGVVSRKKQVIPPLMSTLQNYQIEE